MKRIVALMCAFIAVALGLSAQQATVPPGDYVIGGITVRGARHTEEQTVILVSGLSQGRSITLPGQDISKAISKLWKQDIFSDVQIEVLRVVDKEVFLLIVVAERPTISRYSFKGIRKGKQNELREKIKFVRGTIFTESKSRNAQRIIRNFYQEKGYLNTKVAVETRPDTTEGRNGVAVLIRTSKGPRVKVRNIEIEGNVLVKDGKVAKMLKETKERRAYRFWKRSRFVRAKFNEDKENLIKQYNSRGYRDIQVLHDTIVQISPGLVDLKMKLYEGPKYYFRNVSFTGNSKYDSRLLGRVLRIKKGDTYDSELLDKRLSGGQEGGDLSSLYLDDGYLFFRADPVEVAIVNDSIDIEIRMVEGPQATNNKILLEGNHKTSDHVILREIRTLPGEKFSRAQIIRSQREILALGFFDQQKMNIVPIPDPNKGTVDIKYVVEERSNDQITLQGGYSGVVRDNQGNVLAGGLLATVGLQFNNFSTRRIFDKRAWKPLPSGDGQKLSLQVQTNGSNFQSYGISFLEPWFGGKKPNSLGFNLSYSIQQQPVQDYRLNIFNASVDYGRRLTWPDDFFRSFTTLRYSQYNLKNAERVFPDTRNGQVHVLSLRQTIDRTSIDAPIFSRSGSVFTLTAEATLPWSAITGNAERYVQVQRNLGVNVTTADQQALLDANRNILLEFYKIKADVQTYTPITEGKRPLVLHTRTRFGFLGAYNSDRGDSPFERFYVGGDGLFGFAFDGREIYRGRGYSQPNIGPEAGATTFAQYIIELRQAITLEQSAMVWVLGFAEANNAWGSIAEFNPFSMKRSVGFGLRAFLPMFGLLGIDYGYGLDNVFYQGANLGGGRFHFMIGQQL